MPFCRFEKGELVEWMCFDDRVSCLQREEKIIVVNSLLAQKVALLYFRLAERKGQRTFILPLQPSTGD